MAGGRKRRSWPRFLAKYIIPCLLASLLVGVCAHDTWNRRQFQARLDEARKQGPVTFEELQAARRPWADEENAALVLWERREELEGLEGLLGTVFLENDEDTWVELPNWFQPSEDQFDVLLMTPGGIVEACVSETESDPYRFRIESEKTGIEVNWHIKCGELKLPIIGNQVMALGQRWDSETLHDVHAFLSRHEDLLAQIDRMADFEGGRLPFAYSADPMDTGSQGLGIVRPAFKVKALQMHARVMSGKTDALLEDIDVLLTIAEILEDDPALISALVRVSLHEKIIDYIEAFCALGVLNDDTLNHLSHVVDTLDRADRLYWGMLGDRALWYEVYNVYIDTSMKKPFLRGMAARNMGLVLDHYGRYLVRARDSVKGFAFAGTKKQSRPAPDSRYYLLANMMMPSLERSFELDVNVIAKARAARVALALERCRLKTGRFPESSVDLVPGHLESVPEDPFNGQPLRCKVEDDGRVLIYSVGQDGQDDGGQFDPKKHETDGLDQGFILLPVERRGKVTQQ